MYDVRAFRRVVLRGSSHWPGTTNCRAFDYLNTHREYPHLKAQKKAQKFKKLIDPQTVNLKSNLSCRYTCITLDRHSTSMIYNACTYSYVSVKLCKSMYKVVHV